MAPATDGTVAVLADLHCNLWDLLQLTERV
jgi:hypothetical protein